MYEAFYSRARKAKSIEEVKVEAVEANIVSTKEEEITVAKEAISEEDIAEVCFDTTNGDDMLFVVLGAN